MSDSFIDVILGRSEWYEKNQGHPRSLFIRGTEF